MTRNVGWELVNWRIVYPNYRGEARKGRKGKGEFGTGRWTDIFRVSMKVEPDRRGCEETRW